jgi:hypothetical protein
MREMLLRRLETVEETHRLKNGPPQTISVCFVNGDGSRVSPKVAWTMADWTEEQLHAYFAYFVELVRRRQEPSNA